MTSYKEPFIKAWNKLLKNDLFPNILSNAQPIKVLFLAGSGWDWLDSKPSLPVEIEINEQEIIQCNCNDSEFVCYVNFGKGYKFLHIPYSSISAIIIGADTNWIQNPVREIEFNLKEETITYLNEEVRDDTVETVN